MGEKKKYKINKKSIICLIFLVGIIILAVYLYYEKLRVALMAKDVYKDKMHYSLEYHIDFNTEDNDEQEGFIKSLGSGADGFVVLDKDGRVWKGTGYSEQTSTQFCRFYKTDKELYIDLKSMLLMMVSMLDKEKKTKLFDSVSSMDEYYLTQKQIYEIFGIETNSIEIDWKPVIKKAMSFKRCDTPKDIHLSIDTSKFDFYKVVIDDDRNVVFGIRKGLFRKDYIYISFINKTTRLEIYGNYHESENLKLNLPNSAIDEDEVESIRQKYRFAKAILELLLDKC